MGNESIKLSKLTINSGSASVLSIDHSYVKLVDSSFSGLKNPSYVIRVSNNSELYSSGFTA